MAFDDPFPTPDELMQRSATLNLVHVLIAFARDHGDLRQGEKHQGAAVLAEKIVSGFGIFNDHARSRLRNAEAALRDIRLAMPPAPIVVGDKVATYCPPEAEQRHMYALIRAAIDRFDASQRLPDEEQSK